MDAIWGCMAAFAFLLMAGLLVFGIVFGIIMRAWPLLGVSIAGVAVVGVMVWTTQRD